MGKDGLVALQSYGYIAPTALPWFMFALHPWPPLRSDHGLRIWRPVAGLSLSELFDRIADSYSKEIENDHRKRVGMEGRTRSVSVN